MMDFRNPFNYPLNPDFGTGIFRRRIRLAHHNGYVSGDIEDCNHGFQVEIYHDGKQVTQVEGQARRTPFTTCPFAINPLKQLAGIPLGLSAKALAEQVNARANCTHWLDTALLAISHAARTDEPVRQYDIEIPDELEQGTTVTVKRNQTVVLQWLVKDWQVVLPEQYAGNPLFKGFSAWAGQIEDEELREAVFVMQKAYFVSRARYFDTNSMAGESAAAHPSMYDACFTYSEPQRSQAQRTSQTNYDFTDTEEQLLKFL